LEKKSPPKRCNRARGEPVGSRLRAKRWPFTSSSPSSAQTTSKAPFGVAVTSRSVLNEQKDDSEITRGDPTGVSAARAGSGRRRIRRIRERDR
jgi:hypothetical protein